MTRGNQRELARAKNMKKTVKKSAAEQDSNKGLSLEQRKARTRCHFMESLFLPFPERSVSQWKMFRHCICDFVVTVAFFTI
ncbi:uncharacterized protein LOC143376810 isoform X1 [Andrena cerasifolii]|uniref:uncharacterized protein LOC143376810 isoform X1 n=1 Tax=Andrena cerasifolii TaxID=2819439 RepID=UPI00403773B8